MKQPSLLPGHRNPRCARCTSRLELQLAMAHQRTLHWPPSLPRPPPQSSRGPRGQRPQMLLALKPLTQACVSRAQRTAVSLHVWIQIPRLPRRPWVSDLSALCLSFFTCKVSVMTNPNSQSGSEDSMSDCMESLTTAPGECSQVIKPRASQGQGRLQLCTPYV